MRDLFILSLSLFIWGKAIELFVDASWSGLVWLSETFGVEIPFDTFS